MLLWLPDGDHLVAWLLAEWSCCQRCRFACGLRASSEARHCFSLLVLQAAKAGKKDGEEGKKGVGGGLGEKTRRMKKNRDLGSFV